MQIPTQDRDILRRLAEEQAKIAALPVHQEKAELWRRLNQLDMVRPMVWINEICWNEMEVDDELTLRCSDPWARGVEQSLRRLLYQWRHIPADMIVDDYISCPLVIHSSGFGIQEDVEIVRTDPTSGVVSRHFHRQIVEPEDIEKIQAPVITHDAAKTEEHFQTMFSLFGDILPVRKVGIKSSWFAPWDELIRWWGVQEAMMDLILRPEMVNAAMSRLVDGYLRQLDQWVELNLLTPNNDNTRVGSGGYAYTNELPGAANNPDHALPHNLWGSATAQIFSAVSPEQHWEFALRHELRWLSRWGLTYYGCCEPLDLKVGMLRRIPNLRKVSMSPWVDAARGAEAIGRELVYSCKPSPAPLAEHDWRPGLMRQQLQETLEKAEGCNIEIIMKDISTVRYQPQRLWEWEKIAMELAETYTS